MYNGGWKQIGFTQPERDLLVVAIDTWIEGCQDAHKVSETDPVFQTPEELLEMMAQYDGQIKLLSEVKKRLEQQ